jgi:hypothetical protein
VREKRENARIYLSICDRFAQNKVVGIWFFACSVGNFELNLA